MPSRRSIEAGRAFLKLFVDDNQFRRGLNRASRTLDRWSRNLAIAGGVLTGVGAGFTKALSGPLKFAANIEVAREQIALFTGSVRSADKLLKGLREFSPKALLPFEELSQAAGLLLRFGVAPKNVQRDVEALATVVAGDVEEFRKLALAFAQIAGAGRLFGEEARQIRNTAFNPFREIAEQTGETVGEVRKRMEAGAVSFEEVESTLLAATSAGGRFAGILDKILTTAKGSFLALKTEIKNALLPIGEALLKPIGELLARVRELIPPLAQWISSNRELIAGLLAAGAAAAPLGVALLGVSAALKAISLLLTPGGVLLAGVATIVTAFGQWGNVTKLLTAAMDKFVALIARLVGSDIRSFSELASESFESLLRRIEHGVERAKNAQDLLDKTAEKNRKFRERQEAKTLAQLQAERAELLDLTQTIGENKGVQIELRRNRQGDRFAIATGGRGDANAALRDVETLVLRRLARVENLIARKRQSPFAASAADALALSAFGTREAQAVLQRHSQLSTLFNNVRNRVGSLAVRAGLVEPPELPEGPLRNALEGVGGALADLSNAAGQFAPELVDRFIAPLAKQGREAEFFASRALFGGKLAEQVFGGRGVRQREEIQQLRKQSTFLEQMLKELRALPILRNALG